jgi:hypothetical protein
MGTHQLENQAESMDYKDLRLAIHSSPIQETNMWIRKFPSIKTLD